MARIDDIHAAISAEDYDDFVRLANSCDKSLDVAGWRYLINAALTLVGIELAEELLLRCPHRLSDSFVVSTQAMIALGRNQPAEVIRLLGSVTVPENALDAQECLEAARVLQSPDLARDAPKSPAGRLEWLVRKGDRDEIAAYVSCNIGHFRAPAWGMVRALADTLGPARAVSLLRELKWDASIASALPLAECLVVAGEVEDARIELARAAPTNTLNATFWFLKGHVEFKCRAWEAAFEMYSTAHELAPNDGQILLVLFASCVNTGRDMAARTLATEILRRKVDLTTCAFRSWILERSAG